MSEFYFAAQDKMIIEKGGGDVAKSWGHMHVTTPRQYSDSFDSPRWDLTGHAVSSRTDQNEFSAWL
jgi:hypothetical protein